MRNLTAITCILCLVSVAKSEDTILLSEAFSGDELPATWQAGGKKGAFTIVDGSLQGIASPIDSHGPSIGVPIKGHDLKVQFDFKLSKPGYFLFMIDGDSQFQGQAHLLRFAATSKQVQLMQDRGDPKSKREQKLARDKLGGKRTAPTDQQQADPSFYRIDRLVQQTATPADGEWHHVKVESRGNVVTAQVDNQATMTAEASVLDVPKSRLVFLVGQAGTIHIDNVVSEKLEKQSQKQ